MRRRSAARARPAYEGDWKLIRREEPLPQGDGAMRELYNLRDDVGETTNLAAIHPDRVRALEAIIDRLLADAGAVVPAPNPAFRRSDGPAAP